MSNADLYAKRNQIEQELYRIRSENNRLQGEINQAVGQIDSLRNQLQSFENSVNGALANSEMKMNNSISMSDQALGLQQQIEEMYPLYMNMEEADKNSRQLQQKIYYDFKTYRIVRKIMQGIMDNLDMSLVNEEVIYKAIEKEHLQEPDFWLTSAMLSIMGWKTDRKDYSDRTIANSFKLDPKKTCVFFMIFNLRMAREEAALKWLAVYEQQGIKGEDYETFLMMFSLISKTVYENVSTKTRTRIETFVDKILKESIENENFSEDSITSMICNYLSRTKTRQDFDCPAIRKYTDAYEYLVETLSLAQNNESILDWICTIVNPKTDEHNAYLKHYMDTLIASPNDVEKETYEQIELNDLIIEKYGRKEEAQIAFAEELHRRSVEINLVSEMTNTVHDSANKEVNSQMRKNIFVILKDYEKRGYEKYLNDYRSRTNSIFNIKILDYSSDADFRDVQTENKRIESFYDNWLANELAKIKDTSAYIMFGCGVAALVGSIFIKLIMLGIGVFVLLGVIGGVTMLVNKTNREHLVEKAGSNKTSVKESFGQIVREYNVALGMIKKYDDISESILDEFAKI